MNQSAPAKEFLDFINANPKATDRGLGATVDEVCECPLRASRAGNPTDSFPPMSAISPCCPHVRFGDTSRVG